MTRRHYAKLAALGAGTLAASPSARAAAAPAPGPAPAPLQITILGDSSCIPDPGREPACLLINGRHLVDTGWCAVLAMRELGFDPMMLESVILTHFHQDHYLGLPQLLFYLGLRKRKGAPFQVIGPAEHLPAVVAAADAFLQLPRFPELALDRKLMPMAAGQTFELGALRFETFAARHVSGKGLPEPALAYKVTDAATGACAVLTGDTHPHPPLAGFARGASLLIHDAVHTSPREAAAVAREAGVAQLALIHYPQSRAAAILAEARSVFPATVLAKAGETLRVGGN